MGVGGAWGEARQIGRAPRGRKALCSPRPACLAVTTVTGIDAGAERVGLATAPESRYGVRWWLLCPRRGGRRVHLYGVAAGWLCRGCARLSDCQ